MPLELQHFPWWVALTIFAGVGLFTVLLGLWSLVGLGRIRKWVVIGVRLCVLLMLILILGGARWQREHEDLEVVILNDASGSIDNVPDFPGKGQGTGSVQQALNRYYHGFSTSQEKKKGDRIGMVSFRHYARVDAMPNTELQNDTRGTWTGKPNSGTDIAAAIRLALATLSPDAMHRLVLVSDGNANMGDLESAINAARAQNVQIDVVPLKYDVQNDVMVDRFIAPEFRRENEPFDLTVVMKSTNSVPVNGTLRVKHLLAEGEVDLDMDPTTAKVDINRQVTLQPGLNKESVRVPPQSAAGVHRFKAIFTPEDPTVAGVTTGVNDAVGGNNVAEAFTYVRGEGEVLYVDGTAKPGEAGSPGETLIRKLSRQGADNPGEGIKFRRITIDQFPKALLDLQSFDSIILNNVPRGNVTEGGLATGLTLEQDAMLRAYVHEMGGGLLMIGGPDTFGAGGWQNSEVEKILPVNMDIPAQRNVGKGALVLIMHSCEMPEGNYWGERCAMEAIKSLSVRDEIGVISYGNGVANGKGIGGAQWDVELQEIKNKDPILDAVKRMQLGDMPSFDDAVNLGVNGVPGGKSLVGSRARHKHMIIISDGDPAAPQESLIQRCRDNNISISTITVYPHVPGSARPPVMDELPKKLKGKAYGPIENNPTQLPQIFIKEAQIVKRSLIQEPEEGVPLSFVDTSDELLRRSVGVFPPLRGMVLTSRKTDPKVMVPIATGPLKDPILAYWQSGLGKSAVWTSDAHNVWAANWVETPGYTTLFAQIIRKLSRPPMSGDFDVKTKIDGDKGEITVEALNKDADYQNFLTMSANIVGGQDLKTPQRIRLVQVGPGTYRGTFNANEEGVYVAAINYSGGDGKSGPLLSGTVKNGTLEDRDLKSNEPTLRRIADETHGRVLPAFDIGSANVFTREGLAMGQSLKPIWDQLLPWLLALIILDVAVRRIAWDWHSTKKMAFAVGQRIRSFTVVRQVESKPTLDALRKVREEVAETRFKQNEQAPVQTNVGGKKPPPVPASRPNPTAKFDAGKAVEGDITQVVGGATNKAIPSAPKKIEPKGGDQGGGHLGGLMAAKKRAQQQIKEKEQGE